MLYAFKECNLANKKIVVTIINTYILLFSDCSDLILGKLWEVILIFQKTSIQENFHSEVVLLIDKNKKEFNKTLVLDI